MVDLKEHVENHVELVRRNTAGPKKRGFSNMYEPIYEFGYNFTDSGILLKDTLPKECQDKVGMCFKASANLALGSSEHFYCEGLATFGSVPIHHAWCVDTRGRVVDPTWDDVIIDRSLHGERRYLQYYGIIFREAHLRKILIDTHYYGIMDNYILKKKHKHRVLVARSHTMTLTGVKRQHSAVDNILEVVDALEVSNG